MRKALSFLTPFGGASVPSPAALGWFPVVGALIGLAVGTLWWVAGRWWPPLAAGAIALVADMALTGLLHIDGLADTADGLLPPLPRDRRLQVMADPSVGAFGITTVVAVLALRFAAFGSATPAPLAVAGLWCASRAAMAAVTGIVPYVRPGGLATAFLQDRTETDTDTELSATTPPKRPIYTAIVVGCSLSAGLVTAAKGLHGVAALGAELVAFACVVLLARRRIGGFTGDVLGAAAVVGETVGLLALAAR